MHYLEKTKDNFVFTKFWRTTLMLQLQWQATLQIQIINKNVFFIRQSGKKALYLLFFSPMGWSEQTYFT